MSKLRAEFTALRTTVGSLDPVQLRFIESLLLKAERSTGPLAQVLEKKVGAAMRDYRELARGKRSNAPGTPPGQGKASGPHSLTQLLNSLQGDEQDAGSAPLEHAMRQQELELVGAFAGQSQAPATVSESAPVMAPVIAGQDELRAARRFHSAMVRLNADKVVMQANAEVPADCGPLNPQRLATSSLQTMKDLSPHYLNRFVSYIDTLFWLERAERGTR